MAGSEKIELSADVANFLEETQQEILASLRQLEERPKVNMADIERRLDLIENGIERVVQPYVERAIRSPWATPLIVIITALVTFLLATAIAVRFPPQRWPLGLPGVLQQNVPLSKGRK